MGEDIDRKLWLEDIDSIILTVTDEVQKITGLKDDNPVIDKLMDDLKTALDKPEISYGDWRNYN